MSHPFSDSTSELQPSSIPATGSHSNDAPDTHIKPEHPRPCPDGDAPKKDGAKAGAANADKGDLKARICLALQKRGEALKKNPKPPKMLQQRFRRHVIPKNAIVALQELYPYAKYHLSHVPGNKSICTAMVVVRGVKYRGVGSTKSLARAAACELALQTFVRQPTCVRDEAGGQVVVDETPWSVLSSFAIHKLLCDWRRGVFNTPLTVESAAPDDVDPAAASAELSDIAGRAVGVDEHAHSMSVPKTSGELKRLFTDWKRGVLPGHADEWDPLKLLDRMRPDAHFETVPLEDDDPAHTAASIAADSACAEYWRVKLGSLPKSLLEQYREQMDESD